MRSVEIGRPKTASGAALRTPLLPQGAPSIDPGSKAEQPPATHSDFHTTELPGLPGTHQGKVLWMLLIMLCCRFLSALESLDIFSGMKLVECLVQRT